MSVPCIVPRIPGALRLTRVIRCSLAVFCVACPLFLLALSQQSEEAASLSGTVRDVHGNPVADVTVQLQSREPVQTFTVHTDSQGKYGFSSLREGVYVLCTTMAGYEDARISSLFLGLKEAKTVDLTLGSPKTFERGAAAATQPQFFDQPQFTVAGVTDTTNLGGHGSDTIVRTREKIAKETASLSKASAGKPVADPTAEKSLRESAEHNPSSFAANHNLGKFLIENGKAAEAIFYLERAAKLNPMDYGNSYDLALANAEAGNYDRARDSVRRLIAEHDEAELHHLLGGVEEKLGDPLEAVRQYQRAAELDPTEIYLFDWGSELLLHHAPEPALEVFAKGNHLFPRSARMLIGLGAAWFARGSYEEAARRICEASDLNPNDPNPYLFLGKMQRAEATSSVEVVDKLRRFVTLQPENAEANYYYAVSLWKLRSQEKAPVSQVEALLNKAVQLDPKFAAADLQLGILHSEGGHYAAAILDYQRALRIDPQMEEAHYRLAQAYRRVGKTEEAKEELRLYDQCAKESAQRVERERHEIRQFVYTLRNPPSPDVR